ncbi:hypothetical protein [Kitasatospora fiedleri]|uniref:hypothetical protein n=1 Tax=Kitasatospora fiedleri TaxID=2991545 RepID=UPI00249BA445|nr:hypothetical protein [Kitasatospora fiedleri]
MTPADREHIAAAIASAARTVPLQFGPNAIALAWHGETVALSAIAAAEVGRVVLDTLEAMGVITITSPKDQP